MLRKLIATAAIDIAGRRYPVRYYETTTSRGTRRYYSEVILGPTDRVIFDDDSMNSLESKLSILVAASVYSRRLATKRVEAA